MKIMIKIVVTIFVSIAFMLMCSSCSTTTTANSIKMARLGNTTMSYSALNKDAETVRIAVVSALQARKWNVSSHNYPITASIEKGGQFAKVSISYQNDNIIIDTKGSKIDNKAYVPIRYVDFLMKTVNKNLR